MSKFAGQFREFPGLVADNYRLSNCKDGYIFLLTHCHKDHMVSLSDDHLINILSLRDLKLYTTSITKNILSADPEMAKLIPYIDCMNVNQTYSLKLPQYGYIRITPLPSGHCPGAVMFLIQSNTINVLYTGDFRLTPYDVTDTILYEDGTPIRLESIYLDTTFCHPTALTFPDRELSRDILIEKMSEWMGSNRKNKIELHFPCLGYEHMILGIFHQLGEKIFVSESKYNQYAAIPNVEQVLVQDRNSARVSILSYEEFTATKNEICQSHILKIKPSAQWFIINSAMSKNSVYIEKYNMLRIQHSNHCSYSEICQFIKMFTPKSIYPCVIPSNSTSIHEATHHLKHLLGQAGNQLHNNATQKISPKREIQNEITLTKKRSLFTFLNLEPDDGTLTPPSCKKQLHTSSKQEIETSCTNYSQEQVDLLDFDLDTVIGLVQNKVDKKVP